MKKLKNYRVKELSKEAIKNNYGGNRFWIGYRHPEGFPGPILQPFPGLDNDIVIVN